MTSKHKKIIFTLLILSTFTQEKAHAANGWKSFVACLKACLGRNSAPVALRETHAAEGTVIATDDAIAAQNTAGGDISITRNAPAHRPTTAGHKAPSRMPAKITQLPTTGTVYAATGAIAAQNTGEGRISISQARYQVSPRPKDFSATDKPQHAQPRTSRAGTTTGRPPRTSAAASSRRSSARSRASECHDLPGMVNSLAGAGAGTGEARTNDLNSLEHRTKVVVELLGYIADIAETADTSAQDAISKITQIAAQHGVIARFEAFDRESERLATEALARQSVADVKKILLKRYKAHFSHIFTDRLASFVLAFE